MVAWSSFATPFAPDRNTFGYRWNSEWVKRDDSLTGRSLVVLPEYYRLDKDEKQRPLWNPIRADEVPPETGLAKVSFGRERKPTPKTYETPEDKSSCWKTPDRQQVRLRLSQAMAALSLTTGIDSRINQHS